VNQREVGSDTTGFTSALKHVLRQDPDVILVGEVRDVETARIAVQSALTGHFVLSSLHATDAAAALRLVKEGSSDAAFLLRPTPIEQVRDVAAAGETMPPKSTYFFPKVLTGLVFNPLS
jgi:type IV secretory pathway ATPase VirB11/archaellum biosynthesis ATPase